ncbi:hypothetical protein [Porphyromonas levii]|uniref:Uncharacterized protein n=1 Tax=Porphyromonas levii TaxID=28114 RepID=A0A4Y8WNS5_9PORP|nr:hypothetical protein [Porphyromonas levii]TFH94834.1 hypothetical protein E4P47_05975 [Porphyromonas levii]TFH95568.1 hypothetical protein E4P48_07545 [Porphyromonas levii]
MMNRRIIAAAIITLLIGSSALAQEKWYQKLGTWVEGEGWQMHEQLPTSHTKYLFLAGKRSVIDEYLSPTAHSGWEIKADFLTDFKAPIERPWHLYQEVSVCAAEMKNPANGGRMYTLGLGYDLGPSWRILRYKGLTLDLAPLVALSLKSNYKPANTNNIANVKGSLGIDACARLRYQIPWRIMPLSISYSAQLPLLQCTFHPDYGQSYYDYVSGENGAKLGFHFGALHNTRGLRQRLLIDMPINSVTVTLGAEHTYLNQRLSHTIYREGSWGIVLGFSVDVATFSGNQSLKSSQIHSTLYR